MQFVSPRIWTILLICATFIPGIWYLDLTTLKLKPRKLAFPLSSSLEPVKVEGNTRTTTKGAPVRINKTVLQKAEKEFQRHLTRLQNPQSCQDSSVLVCGHNWVCGFACQMQHRMSCAMLSYAEGLPWYHTADYYWPYNDSWDKYLRPVGTSCPFVTRRIDVGNWQQYKNFLDRGLPVPAEIALKVAQAYPRPFLWFVGQFMKFLFKLTPATKRNITRLRRRIGIRYRPALGIHVRQTDKMLEAYPVPLAEYVSRAANYLKNLTRPIGRKRKKRRGRPILVFVASEDHTVLPFFRRGLGSATVRVVGFEANETMWNELDRASFLFEVIRDVVVLSECQHVICTLSSNICRMILELKAAAGAPVTSVESLDEGYQLKLHKIPEFPHKILPKR